jgi:hypothetical protein
MRLDVELGNDVSLGSDRNSATILSPDGTRLVYKSHSKLFVRRLDQAEATELPGTEEAQAPSSHQTGSGLAFSQEESSTRSPFKEAI